MVKLFILVKFRPEGRATAAAHARINFFAGQIVVKLFVLVKFSFEGRRLVGGMCAIVGARNCVLRRVAVCVCACARARAPSTWARRYMYACRESERVWVCARACVSVQIHVCVRCVFVCV